MKITILGSGSSRGVPVVGNDWGTCDPGNPKNRRTRASILVEDGPTAVLVDSGADCREQLLRANVQRLDAVLYTHAHADHIAGIDDLVPLTWKTRQPIPAYGSEATINELLQRFRYCFKMKPNNSSLYHNHLSKNVINGRFNVNNIEIEPISQDHGTCESLGFRFGGLAYSSDVVNFSPDSFRQLEGLKTWIVDCVRGEPYPTHAHLDKVLGWIEHLKPERTILTHMGNTLDYETLRQALPAHVEPGFDGMVIEA